MGLDSPEPPPVKNDGTPIWELVVEDMKARDRAGREKYGTPLQSFNGRKPLVDLYQELLDAVVYTRQKIEEERTLAWREYPDIVEGLKSVSNGTGIILYDPECKSCVALVGALTALASRR